MAPVSVPPAPPSVAADPEQVADWETIWRLGHGVYKDDRDGFIVERYVNLLARRRELLRILTAEGLTTQGSQGQVVAHPAARLLGDVESKLPPLEDRLGLSPEAAIRLGLAATEAQSKLDRFFEKHNTEGTP